jgi:hypothetical protein
LYTVIRKLDITIATANRPPVGYSFACFIARSIMISSEPPPMAETRVSR